MRDPVRRRVDLAERERVVVERRRDRVGRDPAALREDLADEEHRREPRARPVRCPPSCLSTIVVDSVLVVMKTSDQLTDLFRERGLRVTPQRQAIFRLLHGDDAHPTVESLYERARAEMPTISLKTVYQTVHDLEALGEVDVLDLGTGSVRVDPNVEDDAPPPRVHRVRPGARPARRVRRSAGAGPLPPRLHGRRRAGDLPRPLRRLLVIAIHDQPTRSNEQRCPSSREARPTTT